MSKSKLSIDEVKHVANLAKLTLSNEEIEKIRPQLENIIKLINELQKLPTENEELTAQVTGLVNVFRDDVIDSSRQFSQEEALKNAKRTHNGFFVVPKILN